MNEHFEVMGHKVRDRVTGFVGVVESISFDLYGCVQAVVRPPVDAAKPAELGEGRWFDAKRLEIIGETRVMEVPAFDVIHGGAAKPPFARQPPG